MRVLQVTVVGGSGEHCRDGRVRWLFSRTGLPRSELDDGDDDDCDNDDGDDDDGYGGGDGYDDDVDEFSGLLLLSVIKLCL